jgi:hypothetical protein
MARQTLQPDEWIIADGGIAAARCTLGQVLLRDPQPPGAANFANNLLNGLATATGELVVVAEDDDWYAPDHIETLHAAAMANPRALAIGDDCQRYYNVAHRCWRRFANVGASLCQTAIRREAVPALVAVIRDCLGRGTYGIDTTFWRSIPRDRWALTGRTTVLGIKGLPGCAGLGIGHRPGAGWTDDTELVQLRAMIGEDAGLYAGFYVGHALPIASNPSRAVFT